MTTPLPPWQGYVEFVANPANLGPPPPPSILLQDDGFTLFQDDGVSTLLI